MSRYRLSTPTKRGIGKIRIKMAKLLSKELGVLIQPHEIWIQLPVYRTRYWDCALWGSNIAGIGSLCSWSKMTDCVRYGFIIDKAKGINDNAFADLEVHAKTPGR